MTAFTIPLKYFSLLRLSHQTSDLANGYTVEYRRIVGRLISKVNLFKPSFFASSYGTVLMFSFVIWLNMCGDRSLFLFTKFSFLRHLRNCSYLCRSKTCQLYF